MPATQATHATGASQINNQPTFVGAIVGSLFAGALLSFGGLFLYKWNKNKQNQRNAMPIYGNENYNNQTPITIPGPVIRNHGQEAFSMTNNERIQSQSINELRREIQDLRQVILSNNGQVTRNNNYY